MKKVHAEALYQLPARGYLTVQIPNLVIDFGSGPLALEFVELPDDYVELLTLKGEPAKEGILYWTPKGYAAHKEQIRAAFEASPTKRGTWDEFEAKAAQYYAHREKTLKKLRTSLIKKVEAVTAALLR